GTKEMQAIIEEAVAEVFAAALPGLRAEIVGRAAKEIEALTPAPGESPTGILSAAMASIQEASSQAEILRSLLEGEARFAGRVALFVVNGWQGIGFEDNDIIKTVNLNAASGLAGRAIQGRAPAAGRAADFDFGFLKTVKPPVENNCLVLPLVVKEKVAALIYADAGSIPGSVDASALSVLPRVAALWREVTAMRKRGAAPAEEAQAAAAAAAPIPSATPAAAGVGVELHKKA